VLVYGVAPLRIYLHKMAFARFATANYVRPTGTNLKNLFMHLTNYAINKNSDDYEDGDADCDDSGHKRSLGAILTKLR
jgi:tubulin polyglutamylase TTLL6/13